MFQTALPGLSPPFLAQILHLGPAHWSLHASGPLSRSDLLPELPLPHSSARLKCCFPTCPAGNECPPPSDSSFSALCPGYLGPCRHPLALPALCGLVACWIHLWVPCGVHLHLDVDTYSPKACCWSDWAVWGETATTSVLQKHF